MSANRGLQSIVHAGPAGSLLGENGEKMQPPADWIFLPAGDAAVTRRVTATGEFWRLQATMGRRLISKGVWAPAVVVARAREEIEATRSTAAYQRKTAAAKQRRQEKQRAYEGDFLAAVRRFLAFAPRYEKLEEEMATLITAHAVPVGSGTVARTALLPLEERAARAVIAWMRHQTTAYDTMSIPRQKGMRREVRRQLAARSRQLLDSYRDNGEIAADCPLRIALAERHAHHPA